ncbi:DegQ family serine endoprotease [Thiopseudomonas alkaliphila]|uniref:DegQ family serine endoprotease n=1 Tax=Thiopseudomonas alkaliphila TaxID=1697053 RepID=UPI0025770B9B|nr:DegQ family serine endoprotease [Thiopseudomonas alkaliphila]MDM1715757.1 DegQ family serine endoprotease [Thiopseudomonas alkaliphila]
MSKMKTCIAAVFSVFLLSSNVTLAKELPDFTQLVELSSPAVVNISTRQKVNTQAQRAPQHLMPDFEGLPPIFREFFEHSFPQPRQAPRGQQPQAQSLGSGFIISQDGYILTNNHVIDGADEILVRLSDRSELQAKLIGADPRTDVALLKVEGKNLPVAKIGQSNDLKVGEWVLAIGSPFGFDHSVTKGIVSAKGRSLPNENYVPFIQTDVAINPGNSGGPLFNLKGEVVGINSQIFTRSGGFMGLSFAIPMDVAMGVAEQLKAEGKVNRGWLGVIIQEVNKELAESFGLDKPAGALVVQILEDGPAAKSKLQVGDIILSVNQRAITLSSDLPHYIGTLKAGDTAKLEVLRSGKKQNIAVKVGGLPEEGAAQASAAKQSSNSRLGMSVQDLTKEQLKQLEITSGVVVNHVEQGPAALIGLRPGDVITHLNQQTIESAKAFSKIVAELPAGKSLSMRVLRQGRASFISFKLSK